MPTGSLASRDFFGDSNYATAGVSISKLETLSENHVSGDYGKHCLNGMVQANEQYSMDFTATPSTKDETKDATTLKRETQQKDSSAKCQCILS